MRLQWFTSGKFICEAYDEKKHVRLINFCCHRAYILQIIQKPMEKSYWVFGEGTKVMNFQVGLQK